MKVSELASHPPKVLIYGPAGRAKTALALTLGGRCEYLDLDDNMEVAFGLKDNLQHLRLDVNVKQFIDRDATKATAFDKFKQYVYKISAECHKKTYPHECVVVDSLTSVAVGAHRKIMASSGGTDKNPQIQHWGLILNEIENIITILRALPIRMFMIAHQMEYTDDNNTVVQIAVPGQKLPGRITRMFSEIWYVRMRAIGQGKFEFYIQTAPTTSITCRSGRGLKSGVTFGTIEKSGKPGTSIGLWDILDMIETTKKPKETATMT